MRRTRITVGGAVCLVAALAVPATAAAAAPPPPLATVYTGAVTAGPGADSDPDDSLRVDGLCSPVASTFTFSTSGEAGGKNPYSGRFTEEGSFTLGPLSGTGGREVVAFESRFRIVGYAGTVVEGTRRITPDSAAGYPPYAVCTADANRNIDAELEYSATIDTTADTRNDVDPGRYADRGIARVNLTTGGPESFPPDGLAQYSAVFRTSLDSPEALPATPPGPVDPVDPVDSAEPMDPADPMQPTGPGSPVEPSGPGRPPGPEAPGCGTAEHGGHPAPGPHPDPPPQPAPEKPDAEKPTPHQPDQHEPAPHRPEPPRPDQDEHRPHPEDGGGHHAPEPGCT